MCNVYNDLQICGLILVSIARIAADGISYPQFKSVRHLDPASQLPADQQFWVDNDADGSYFGYLQDPNNYQCRKPQMTKQLNSPRRPQWES
jgi:hypothetical protein